MLVKGEIELDNCTHPTLGVVKLYHRLEGLYVAGAGTLMKPEGWGVRYVRGNTSHGRSFRTEAEARTLFNECKAAQYTP